MKRRKLHAGWIESGKGMALSDGQAAEDLYHCLLEMGEVQTNPVLLVMSQPDEIIQGKKYPPGNLKFAGKGLRAYYHSHAEPYLRKDEHGHFHIFIATVDGQQAGWSHLAALSVDTTGQPQNWMTVNQWVTGENLFSDVELKTVIATLPSLDTEAFSLVEKWIFNMLLVYRPHLERLLELRDKKIRALTKNNETEAVLNDRGVYVLSESAIDLLKDLSLILENKK